MQPVETRCGSSTGFSLPDTQGVGFYRGMLPASNLTGAGHHVAADTRLPDQAHAGAFDTIIGMRVCNDGASKTWQTLARAGHTKLVFEIDDDLWHVDASNRPAAAFYHGERLDRLSRNIEVADVVTVTTDHLANVVSEWNRNVRVVPNQIPAWLLDHERPVSSAGLTVIGWRGGASHNRDFGELAAPLRRFLQHPARRGRVEFHSMGVDYTPRVQSRHAQLRHTDWLPVAADFLRAIDFDIAVIPLRPSTFNDSKSELALLEMSALGIPSIVSCTGPYERAMGAGAPVLCAKDAGEWAMHLDALTDPVDGAEMRAAIGKAAHDWATTRTVEGNIDNWIRAYQS